MRNLEELETAIKVAKRLLRGLQFEGFLDAYKELVNVIEYLGFEYKVDNPSSIEPTIEIRPGFHTEYRSIIRFIGIFTR